MKAKRPLHVWLLVRYNPDGTRWIVGPASLTRRDAEQNKRSYLEPRDLVARKFVMEEPKR